MRLQHCIIHPRRASWGMFQKKGAAEFVLVEVRKYQRREFGIRGNEADESCIFRSERVELIRHEAHTVHVIQSSRVQRRNLLSVLSSTTLPAMSKRTFAQIESSPPDLPLKRIHTSTPAPGSTSSAFSTPYTPSVYSIPADSPTNPLGLKRRVNNLTVPKASPFSKHVALRFQLIAPAPEKSAPPPKPSLWNTPPESSPASDSVYSKNPDAEQYAREGTYRIVQVPLSYSFRLLRAVILYIFSGEPSVAPHAPGHLLSVQHGITIGSPGEIASGRVRVKLSRARDPYYSSRSLADLIAAADAQGQGEEDLEDEEEDASWRWEGEDDFTLGHVWDVRSRDPKRGIIYVRAHPFP
jgi:hypothetical protein